MKIALILRKSCQIFLVGYVACFILRISIFFEVHSEVKLIDKNHVDKGLGSFFGEYIEDESSSIVITALLIIIFFGFYCSNFYIIK